MVRKDRRDFVKVGDRVELISVKEIEAAARGYGDVRKTLVRNPFSGELLFKVGDHGSVVKMPFGYDELFEVEFHGVRVLCDESMIRTVDCSQIPESGILNNTSATAGAWKETGPITMEGLTAITAALPKLEDPNVALWRKRILDGWAMYGVTGEALDPRTVEHLAREFAKPIEWPKVELKNLATPLQQLRRTL
jgi:hypothetical protein